MNDLSRISKWMRDFRLKLVCAMLLCLTAAASFSSAAERRVALVIGVWEYDAPGLANLPGIEADVKRFAERVQQLGFDVTIVKNPNISEAKDAIDQFGER